MDTAIILAAGKGERLVNGFDFPKPLKRVGGVPLLVRVLRSLEQAGVREAAIVVGHLGEVLVAGLARYRFSLGLRFFWNDEVDKPNGTSLLKAGSFVDGPTTLLMSDHLFSPDLLDAVRCADVGPSEAALGVDFNVPRCFDLADATKVLLDDDQIVDIGKALPRYHALDTGVFRITPALVDELSALDGPEGCSLSQGVAALAARGRMRAVDVGDARWIDVDTPAAHGQAEQLVRRWGATLRPMQPAPRMVAGL